MTYTCIKEFISEGVTFRIGQRINATLYISLTAEERQNFIEDFKPLKVKP